MTHLLVFIPFIGFVLGCVLFFLFLPMYAIIWWKKFNAVSKLAQLEKVEWKYFCSPIQGFQRAFFPDQLITQTDSEQMLLVKKTFINHVKIGWKIVFWWFFVEALLLLGAVVSFSLAHFQK